MRLKTILSSLFVISSNLFASSFTDHLNDSKIFEHGFTQTSGGKVAWISTRSEGPTVLFLHGNSKCKEVFGKQLTDPILASYRLVAVDFPGYGQSDDASDPKSTYSMNGLAKVISDVADHQGYKDMLVVGWSLGGHTALALAKERPDLVAGLLLTGTPPIAHSPEGFGKGFKPFEGGKLMGHLEKFTSEEASQFVSMGGFNPNETSFLVEACQRADGRARHLVLTSTFMGEGINEEAFITETKLPVVFVHGMKDQGINGDYIQNLPIKNLKGFHILNTDHATFWQDHTGFNKILRGLAEDIFRK